MIFIASLETDFFEKKDEKKKKNKTLTVKCIVKYY